MANLNKPGSGMDMINKVLKDNNPNMKQYIMQPSSGVAKLQKNVHTPKTRNSNK